LCALVAMETTRDAFPTRPPASRYWCHSCEALRPVTLLGVRGEADCPVCTTCAGNFVELVDAGVSSEAGSADTSAPRPMLASEGDVPGGTNSNAAATTAGVHAPGADATVSIVLETILPPPQADISGMLELLLDMGSAEHPSRGINVGGTRYASLEELVQHMSFIENTGRNSAQPTAAAVLESLPRTTVGSSSSNDAGGESETARQLGGKDCCICMCEFESGDVATTMPCGHSFHAGCITQWLRTHHTCPVCREALATEEDVVANVDPSSR